MQGEWGTGVTNGKGGRTERGRGPRVEGADADKGMGTERKAGDSVQGVRGPMEEGGCTEQKGSGPQGKGCRERGWGQRERTEQKGWGDPVEGVGGT